MQQIPHANSTSTISITLHQRNRSSENQINKTQPSHGL